MLHFDVTKLFNLHVSKALKGNKDLIRFIHDHPRRYIVLKNMCEQVEQFEKRFKGLKTLENRNKIISACANMFIDQAFKEAKLRVQSAMAQKKAKDPNEKMREMQERIKAKDGIREVHDRE